MYPSTSNIRESMIGVNDTVLSDGSREGLERITPDLFLQSEAGFNRRKHGWIVFQV